VELLANWIMFKRVADERTALVRAFYEVVPLQAPLSPLTPNPDPDLQPKPSQTN
jgi:hypothetical protein